MIDPKEIDTIERGVEREAARFRAFLDTHTEKRLEVDGKAVPYLSCGSGPRTLLTFAGGWGGVDLVYDLVLGFETRNRVAAVDISAFADPEGMTRAVDLVCAGEKITQPVLFGQSFSGIPAQVYFRRRPERVGGLVLVNTLAPKPERSKPGVLALMKILPLGLFKPLIRKKLTRLSATERTIPEDVRERRKFAMALLGRMIDTYWTKGKLNNILKLADRFNKDGAPSPEALSRWTGRVLIVTSEDEPYFPDAGLLMNMYPRTEMAKLPSGFGHTAPQIFRDEFFGIIQAFLDSVGTA